MIIAIAAAFDVPMIKLTKDPLQLFESDRFYYGLLSYVGVLLWCSAGAIALFTSRLLTGIIFHVQCCMVTAATPLLRLAR